MMQLARKQSTITILSVMLTLGGCGGESTNTASSAESTSSLTSTATPAPASASAPAPSPGPATGPASAPALALVSVPAPAPAVHGTTIAIGNAERFLHTDGKVIRNAAGNAVVLRGANVDVLTAIYYPTGYFEKRFSPSQIATIEQTWDQAFFPTSDLDRIKGFGLNTIRVPFSYLNLQHADLSWRTNDLGDIDFSHFDRLVDEAGKRGIYVIFDMHIWLTQDQGYGIISGFEPNISETARKNAAAVWSELAKHYRGNGTVAGYDIINEPTGSPWCWVQHALTDAIRAVDSEHIIIWEWCWDQQVQKEANIVISNHDYGLSGKDPAKVITNPNDSQKLTFDKQAAQSAIDYFEPYSVPRFVGEFHVFTQYSASTDPFYNYQSWQMLLDTYRSNEESWTVWRWKGFNEGDWSVYQTGGFKINLQTATYDQIISYFQSISDPNQWWTTPLKTVLSTVHIVEQQSGRCLDTRFSQSTNGVASAIWDCMSVTQNQRWQIGDGEIRAANSNKCLETANGASGDVVKLNDCKGTSNQKWTINSIFGTWGSISAKDTSLCLAVTAAQTDNYSTLRLLPCATKQNFMFELR